MTPTFSSMEKIVGGFILLTGLLFLGTMVFVGRGQHWFEAYNSYYALYREGYNLQPGVKVKLLRMDIGLVTDVELTDDNRAKVTMRILAEYASRIRADSQAAIESPTLIGSEFVNIIPGSKEAIIIKPGGEIPSKEAKKLAEYLEDFDFDYKMKRLDEILENLSYITNQLQDPTGDLFGTLDNIERLTDSVNQGQGTLGKVVKSEEVYDLIVKQLDSISRILLSVEKTARSLKNSVRTAQTGMTSVKKGAKSIEMATADIEAQIPVILERIQSVLKDLETAMTEVPDISQRARRGMRDVNDILESVKRNFLIRGNLPKAPTPESHGLEIRGE